MDQEQQLSFLLERQLKMLIEISTKKYDQEIASLKSTVASLQQDIGTLRANVKSIRTEQAQSPIHTAPIQQHVQAQPSRVEQHMDMAPRPNETPSMTMARTGNFKSEDVSVDKFFYFGNKK